MQTLSALDAISPAFSRTKLVLFSPFRFGRTWKLAASAYLGGVSAAFLPWPLLYLVFIPIFTHQPDISTGTARIAVLAIAGGSVVLTLLYLVFFYLCSRLRFAVFDVVLNAGQFIAPGWRKHGAASLKWTLFKVLLGSAVAAIIALPVLHVVKGFVGTFQSLGANMAPGQPPSPQFMQAIFSVYAAFFGVYLVVGLFVWAASVLGDFVVPSLALEDTTLNEALRRVGVFIRNEPGQFALYSILKLALALVAFIAAGLAFYVMLLIVVLVAGIVCGIIGFLLYLAHVPTAVLVGLAIFFGVLLYVFAMFYGVFVANGTAMTFLESYLLYFLGGRYPMLGDLLAASTPPPSGPPPYPGPHQPFAPPPPLPPSP